MVAEYSFINFKNMNSLFSKQTKELKRDDIRKIIELKNSFWKFNIKSQEDTIKRVAESTTREVVGQTELQPLITTGRENVAQRIQKLTQDTLDAYGSGVAIKQVLIQDATVHPQVMEAFDDVVAAGQDAERFQNEATIYKNEAESRLSKEAKKRRKGESNKLGKPKLGKDY